MRKSEIEKFRKGVSTSVKLTPAQLAERGGVQERSEPKGVELSASTIAALSGAIVDGLAAKLAEMLPVVARIAAADTLHTMQGEDAVMRRAVEEGVRAVEIVQTVRGGMA